MPLRVCLDILVPLRGLLAFANGDALLVPACSVVYARSDPDRMSIYGKMSVGMVRIAATPRNTIKAANT
jgi:hypothetical protein